MKRQEGEESWGTPICQEQGGKEEPMEKAGNEWEEREKRNQEAAPWTVASQASAMEDWLGQLGYPE